MLVIFIVIGILALLLCILYYYGLLTPVKLELSKSFGPRKYLYYNSAGEYFKTSDEWKRVRSAAFKHFKFSTPAGLYYDNPGEVVDGNQCRITFGILVNQGEENKINEFMQENPNYQLVSLPCVEVIKAVFPYRTILSFLFGVMKFYPNLNTYVQRNDIDLKVTMEIYDLDYAKEIQFVAFYGESGNEFILTTDPAPKYKKDQLKQE